MNPTISRALVVPAMSFYIQYDSSRGECLLGFTNSQVSFDVNVVRIEGHPRVFTDLTITQGASTIHTLRQSAEDVQFASISNIGGFVTSPQFSIFLGFSDDDHPLYIDVSVTTGLLEYQRVATPAYQVYYFNAASALRTYHF